MSNKTRIVIVGGGYGGVHAAKTLNKRARKQGDVEVTLIDRNPYHTLMTELHEIAGSRTEPEAVQISFKRIFSGTKVNMVIDEIQSIDFEKNKLKSKTREYDYDYLILGTGGHPEFFGTPGVQENSFTLWSLEDAIRIREHVEIRFREAAKEPDPVRRRELVTFAVAGAGFTGIELAGELLERADTLCNKYHIDRDEVRILVIEAKDTILPTLSKGPQEKALKYLKKKKVEVLINAPIVKADMGVIHLKDGTEIRAGTFVWTCGIQASAFTAKINLTKGKVSNDKCSVASPEGIHGMMGCSWDDDERDIVGERGRILVNEYLQSVDFKNVYLVGDMIWYLYQEKVVPQIVETALQTGETAAHNIISELDKKERKPFEPKYHGFMVSIGGKYGVAHVMGVSLYGFFAMATKHLINVHYLWGVAGFNAVWGYLQEEFFQIKENRSILGGHASAKIPAYWGLLLRLWLGFMWVLEGANKIGEGWLHFNVGSKSKWMFSRGVKQAGTVSPDAAAAAASTTTTNASTPATGEATDATSAASEEWVEGAEGAAPSDPAQAPIADPVAIAEADATSAASEEWVEPAAEAATSTVNTSAANTSAAGAANSSASSTSAVGTSAAGTSSSAAASSNTAAASASTTGVDATSAASEEWVEPAADAAASAAQGVGDAINSVAAAVATPDATPVFAKVLDPADTILPYDSPLVTWFRQTFMDGIFANFHFAFFQTMIVGMELAIGLALMGGFLTWGAALASIGMCFVFTLSGMFSWSQLWFVFAAIVLMGGAGRVAGLDYWVMPWFKRKWNASRLAKRTHLYDGEPRLRKAEKAKSVKA